MKDLDTPLPEEDFALLSGATASSSTSKNPQDSIPLLTQIKGAASYLRQLEDAARDLYRHLRQHPDIKACVGREVIANGKPRGHVPDLSKSDHARYLPACKILLHSLAHIASIAVYRHGQALRRQSYVAIPLGDDQFRKGTPLETISHTAFKSVVMALAHIGWLELVPAHFDKETEVRRRSRIRPRGPFLDWMLSRGLVFHGHPDGPSRATKISADQLLRVNFGGGSEPKMLTRPLTEEEAILPVVNAALRKQRLAVTFPDYATFERSYDFRSGRTRYRVGGQKDLYRGFSLRDGRGGRLYGHWVQRLPADLRHRLTINGRLTVELDFGGMQLALLYASAGVDLPAMADLYDVPGQSRGDMKMVLTRTVGTSSRAEAIPATTKALLDAGRWRSGRAEELYDAFWGHHAGVNPHDRGIEEPWAVLQETDSRLALRILRRLLEEGVTAIPVHDSFVVEARHEDRLRQVMEEEFEALTGLSGVAVRRA